MPPPQLLGGARMRPAWVVLSCVAPSGVGPTVGELQAKWGRHTEKVLLPIVLTLIENVNDVGGHCPVAQSNVLYLLLGSV